jgi:hypothetical protein
MTSLKLELGGIALVVLIATSGRAHAQTLTPSPSDQPSSDPAAPAGCPNPRGEQTGATESCPQQQPQPQPQPQGQAQPQPQPEYQYQPVQGAPMSHRRAVAVAEEEEEQESFYKTVGVAVMIGGGVDDFARRGMRDTTSIGGSWDVRLIIGTRKYLAVEGSYIGSAQSIDALGLSSNARLIGNGAQAAIRLNATTDSVVQPFIYGGWAWRHYSLTNKRFNTSDVSNTDEVYELPAGVGIAGKFNGFIADVRGEYRWTWGEDLVPSLTGSPLKMDRWGVNANVGFEF